MCRTDRILIENSPARLQRVLSACVATRSFSLFCLFWCSSRVSPQCPGSYVVCGRRDLWRFIFLCTARQQAGRGVRFPRLLLHIVRPRATGTRDMLQGKIDHQSSIESIESNQSNRIESINQSRRCKIHPRKVSPPPRRVPVLVLVCVEKGTQKERPW